MRKLRWALVILVVAGEPALAQDIMQPEFTPVCNECVVMMGWRPGDDGRADWFEVYFKDERAPDGRDLKYKGPSTSAFATISGAKVAEIRVCLFYGECSDFVDMPLIPPADPNSRPIPERFRITSPIEFLHLIGEEESAPFAVGDKQSVLLDFTATGQIGCGKGVGNRRWNIGGRMTMTISESLSFRIRNQSVVEHHDNRWTYHGNIVGDHKGTITLTVDDCAEVAYGTVRSDAGVFTIQPTESPQHVVTREAPAQQLSDCAVSITDPGTPIPLGGDADLAAETIRGDRFRNVRAVALDFDRFRQWLAPIQYLVGPDRNHALASFMDPIVSIEFFPGEFTRFDLRHGEVVVRDTKTWQWSGCVAGRPDSTVQLIADLENEQLRIAIRDGSKVIDLRHQSDGSHVIYEYQR